MCEGDIEISMSQFDKCETVECDATLTLMASSACWDILRLSLSHRALASSSCWSVASLRRTASSLESRSDVCSSTINCEQTEMGFYFPSYKVWIQQHNEKLAPFTPLVWEICLYETASWDVCSNNHLETLLYPDSRVFFLT